MLDCSHHVYLPNDIRAHVKLLWQAELPLVVVLAETLGIAAGHLDSSIRATGGLKSSSVYRLKKREILYKNKVRRSFKSNIFTKLNSSGSDRGIFK